MIGFILDDNDNHSFNICSSVMYSFDIKSCQLSAEIIELELVLINHLKDDKLIIWYETIFYSTMNWTFFWNAHVIDLVLIILFQLSAMIQIELVFSFKIEIETYHLIKISNSSLKCYHRSWLIVFVFGDQDVSVS